ncbi:MAG TPA: hypothetical protein EYG18_11085 [Micavibrio sp.]|nr:hypothetical protein [Pseudomonadota bacterium]HIF26373.1 hypothetical protein [Micavibrio sp.]HIL29802.1 hypothetical protein [Micavibrio sp.]
MKLPSFLRSEFKSVAAWSGAAATVITTPFVADALYRVHLEQFDSLREAFATQTSPLGIAAAVVGALAFGAGITLLNQYDKGLNAEDRQIKRTPSPKP